jgi:hypothetical protein
MEKNLDLFSILNTTNFHPKSKGSPSYTHKFESWKKNFTSLSFKAWLWGGGGVEVQTFHESNRLKGLLLVHGVETNQPTTGFPSQHQLYSKINPGVSNPLVVLYSVHCTLQRSKAVESWPNMVFYPAQLWTFRNSSCFCQYISKRIQLTVITEITHDRLGRNSS